MPLYIQHASTGVFVFSFIPKQIFKILQSQKLQLLRTVTHTIPSCLAALSVFMTLARNVSRWVAFCVYALNARQWWMFAFERSDILMRHWGPSENQMKKRDGMREEMWAESSREGVDVKEEWSVKRRKQCRKKKEEEIGWEGSFGWLDLYGGEHWHLFTMLFLHIHHKRQF